MIKRRRLVKDSSTPIEDLLDLVDKETGITLNNAVDDLKRRKGYNDSLLGDNSAINLLMRRFGLEHRDVIRVLNYKFDGRYLKDKKAKDYRLRNISNIKEAKEHITAYIEMFLNNDELTDRYAKKFNKIKKDSKTLNNLGKKVLKFTKDNPKWEDEDLNEEIYRLLKAEAKNIKDAKVKDSDAWHEKAHYELTFEDGHKETDTIPMYVKMGYTDEDILDYFQGYYDDKIVKVKQIGWSRIGDSKKRVKDSVEREVPEENKDALEEFTEWEGIIGYDEDIIDVYESGCAYVDDEYIDYGDSYDALDAYLKWEGILGYTDAIYDILKYGYDSMYYDDMVEDRDSYDD